MEEVVKILMKRDSLSHDEAFNLVDEFINVANEYLEDGAVDELDDLLMEMLGLEPDYLPELLGGF